MYMHFANRHDMRKMNNFDNKIIDAYKKNKNSSHYQLNHSDEEGYLYTLIWLIKIILN